MDARVAVFEGAQSSRIDVPAKEFLFLVDRDNAKILASTSFDSEADRRRGDETLNVMSPPVGEGMGSRTGVEMYDVGIHLRA